MFLHRIGDCPIRSPLGALGAPYPNFGELTNQSFILKKNTPTEPYGGLRHDLRHEIYP